MSPERPPRGTGLFHVITGLDPGGAELALLRLVEQTTLPPGCITVISLTANGEVGERLAAAGAEVLTLGMARGAPDPRGLWRLTRLLRRRRPALIQSWMYHADLVAGLAARLAGGPPVVWNVRNGTIDPAGVRRMTRWTARLAGRLGRWLPARIVCCSRTAQELHAGLGYPEARMVLIPNGFDLTRFQPDPHDRERIRSELGIPHAAPVVGCVGRFDPVKDHHGFLRAAAALVARHAEVFFVLGGAGVDPANARIMEWVRELGLEDRCRLLGHRTDLERVYRALDVLALSSYTEAFPNVVGEGMASGVPCVVTAVGDAPWLVGETGRIVPARDPTALAVAIDAILRLPPAVRTALGGEARARIREHFGLATMVARYEKLYRELTDGVWDRRDH
ncbi:MAG: glycosyltransferase [Gammaproteobacteria bacterium]